MTMKIGMLTVVNEYSADPPTLARKAEALGFESLWLPDHPVSPAPPPAATPETPPGKGEIPDHYSRMCDPFVAMAMAAAATTRLNVATGVCLVPERNPLVTANEIATLDHFSDGRVLFGIGGGWLKEESEVMGADFPHRWTQTKEYIAAMRELWTKEEASFEGKYIKFPPVRLYPKPARKGGPPVLIGSKDKNALRWVAQWGDGWRPILLSPDQKKSELSKLRVECTKAGRDYSTLDLTIMRTLRGNRAEVQSGLRQYEDLGMHRFVLTLIANRLSPDNYATELERLAALYI